GAGLAATAVSGAVRGAILAEAAVETTGFAEWLSVARTGAGRLAGWGAGVATDAGLNALGQTIVTGDGTAGAFVDNVINSVAVQTFLRPMHAIRGTVATTELEEAAKELSSAGKFGRLVQNASLDIAELAGAAGAGYLAEQIRHGHQPASEAD